MLEFPPLIDAPADLTLAGLPHRVREAEGFGPFPTVVLIHGWKGNEDVMWIFGRHFPANWLLVAPRAILPDPDGGNTWYPHHEGSNWPNLTQFDPAVAALHQFIHALPTLYDADLDNLYLMGFSQGAAMSLAYTVAYPQEVQALASLVGFAPRNFPPTEPLADKPVFMSVGTEDERIPLALAHESAERIRTAGAELTYHEYATGHRLTGAGMRDLRAWWETIAF